MQTEVSHTALRSLEEQQEINEINAQPSNDLGVIQD